MAGVDADNVPRMTIDEARKRHLRGILASGDAGAADGAMCELLDVTEPEKFDAADLLPVLDAIERLGIEGRSLMSESFLLFAERFSAASVPVLVRRMKQFPAAWTSQLCATVIHELWAYEPDARRYLERDAAVEALAGTVAAASHIQSSDVGPAVRTLHEWATLEPLPEAGPALAGLLMKAADEPSPNADLLREARETLEANGQSQLLAPARDRAQSLPAGHPLRVVLGL
jgi:hypothetical protein